MTASILGGSTPGVSILRFGVMIVGWYLATLISNMSGKTYVKETLDAMSPTSVSMAFAGVVLAVKEFFKSRHHHNDEAFQSSKHRASTKQLWMYHQWAIGLGFIQFLATALSYSSFALSSVTWTYCFRTLEPLISAILQFCVAGALTSSKELGALLVLAVGIVITVNANSGGQNYAAWLGALALSATVIYSCRSVIGSRVMKWYGRSGADLFILASTYGCVFSLWLHTCVRLLGFGGAVSLSAVRVRQLLVAGGFHCLYNMMSFQILHILQPVAHGVCNTMKRVFMVVMSAVLSGHMLSGVQLLGVMVANLAAGMYGFESKKRAEKEKEHAAKNVGQGGMPLSANGMEQGLNNGDMPLDGDDHTNHSSKNLQAQIGLRLVGIGSVATLIGIGFLLASLYALDLRSSTLGTTELAIHVEPSIGDVSRTEDVKKKVHGVVAVEDKDTFQIHDALRHKCLADIRERIDHTLSPIFHSFGDSIAYVELAHPLQGLGLNLLGAVRAASVHEKKIESVCIISNVPNEFEGSLKCKGTNFLNSSEGSQIILGSGSSWEDKSQSAHDFRLEFLKSLDPPQSNMHHILQLPVSISWDGHDIPGYEQTILEELKNLYFLTSDRVHAEKAKSILPENVNVYECPDIGFRVGPLTPTKPTGVDVVLVLRNGSISKGWDRAEKALLENQLSWTMVEWPEPLDYVKEDALSVLAYAERIAQIEVDLISSGLVLITDDVRAAILAVLAGKAHVIVDSGADSHLATVFDDLANISSNCRSSNLHQTRTETLEEAVHQCISVAK